MTETAVKEWPMLFSSEMTRALLAGRKSQTRRVVSSSNSTVLGYSGRTLWDHLLWDRGVHIDKGPDPFGYPGYQYLHVAAWNPKDGEAPTDDRELMSYRVRPKWDVGDHIWVRESVRQLGHERTGRNGQYRWPKFDDPEKGKRWFDQNCFYLADYTGEYDDEPQGTLNKLFMPRWASRITLEIVGVRVERAHSITDADVRAEGVDPADIDKWRKWLDPRDVHAHAFGELWDRINGKKHPWSSNPWCWIISFQPVPTAKRPG